MYLHIGNGKNIKKKNIIGIFDLDTATVSSVSKKFINERQRAGKIEYNDTDLPRSFIVYSENEKERIILSRISSIGLKERIEADISQDMTRE